MSSSFMSYLVASIMYVAATLTQSSWSQQRNLPESTGLSRIACMLLSNCQHLCALHACIIHLKSHISACPNPKSCTHGASSVCCCRLSTGWARQPIGKHLAIVIINPRREGGCRCKTGVIQRSPIYSLQGAWLAD